jgi:hypothetical protein
MTVNTEKAPEGLSVVKEGQAETGRALMARDLVGVTLAHFSRQQARQKECAESSRSYYRAINNAAGMVNSTSYITDS